MMAWLPAGEELKRAGGEVLAASSAAPAAAPDTARTSRFYTPREATTPRSQAASQVQGLDCMRSCKGLLVLCWERDLGMHFTRGPRMSYISPSC
jgi:hypothetical protein